MGFGLEHEYRSAALQWDDVDFGDSPAWKASDS
jgi:hypothetical protein